ncbi:MAG: peptidylprolyl isomerase [Candidatus Zixiibacteriota bacterium]
MNCVIKSTLVIILFLLNGCGSGQDDVVATVGSSQITLGQVHDFDKLFPQRFASADDEFEAKKHYVDSLIDVRLLVIGAYQNDLDIDKEVLEIMEIQKPKFVLDELFKQKILSKMEVTDAEIKDFYEKLKEEVRVRHILVDRKDLADSLYGAITAGADFEQVARDFSLDHGSAMNGGDLGYQRWGVFLEDFQDQVFKMSKGQISRPFETMSGWHLAMMVDKRESDPGPFDQLQSMLRGRLQDRKRQKVMAEYLDGLIQRVEIRIDEATHQSLVTLVDKMYPDTIGGKYFRKSMVDDDLLQEYQKSEILAYYKGGEMTVEEYFKGVGSWPVNDRPELKDVEAIKNAIFNLNLEIFLSNEAQREELDKTESYMTLINSFKEDIMADRMRDVIAGNVAEIIDQDIYDYYDQHVDEFVIPKKINIREIQIGDLALADSLRRLIDKGQDFGMLAGQHTVRIGMKELKGDLGAVPGYKYPTIFGNAGNMRVGEVKGPFQTDGDKWSIIKVEGIESPKTSTIEDVAEEIRTRLAKERSETALESWLSKRRAETTIDVNYDLIWKTIDKDKYEEN